MTYTSLKGRFVGEELLIFDLGVSNERSSQTIFKSKILGPSVVPVKDASKNKCERSILRPHKLLSSLCVQYFGIISGAASQFKLRNVSFGRQQCKLQMHPI